VIAPENITDNEGYLHLKAAGGTLNSCALLRGTRRLFLIFACLLSVFGIPGWAAAEGNLHVGQLKIHPFFSLSDTVSDNIYSTADEKKSDSIMTYTPGLELELPFGRHKAEVQYSTVMSRHEKYSGEDTTDNNAKGLVDFRFGGGLGLGLSDSYTAGHEPRSSSASGFIEKFKHNVEAVSTSFTADRTKLQFDFGKGAWDYQTSSFRNRDETTFSGDLFYRFLPKTSAFIEYAHGNVAYDDPSLGLDSNADTESVGLTWEITAKSKGTIKAGFQQKKFESSSQENFKGWVSSIDLHHDFSKYIGLTLTGQRTVNEASVPGTSYLVTTGAFAELSYTFIRKLALLARGSYGVDDFSNPIPPDTITRKDQTSLGGLGINYTMRDWLTFGFDYNSRTRRSNFPANDYKENSYVISVKMAL